MLEETGDLWETPADAVCITTNAIVNRRGEAVMGRGCAKEATQKIPGISKVLATKLSHGNDVWILAGPNRPLQYDRYVVSFPVKEHWRQKAKLNLIRKSARELLVLSQAFDWERILLPRPGCGNGQLKWSEVKPAIADILDDRFVAITKENN